MLLQLLLLLLLPFAAWCFALRHAVVVPSFLSVLCTLEFMYVVSCSALLQVAHAASYLHHERSSRYDV